MSRIVRVYDPQRNPPEWQHLLSGSQVAVFTEDANNEQPARDGTGEPTCEIFENARAAEEHCRDFIATNPSFRCLVFDSSGRGGGPISTYESPKLRAREITSRVRRWFSAVMVLSSAVLIWLDWRSDFERMWPSILAWKFLTTALVFITWEIVLIIQRRLQNKGLVSSGAP